VRTFASGAFWIALLLLALLPAASAARAAEPANGSGVRIELLDLDATATQRPDANATAQALPRTLPYRDHGSWIRITASHLPARPRLVVESQVADDVTLVLPDGSRAVRNKLHPDDAPLASPVALVFALPPDLAPGEPVYLHLAHRHLALTAVRVLANDAWQAHERRMLLVGVMLLSALLSFSLASFCVWAVVRERLYLYYAAFLAGWLAFSASNTGLLYAAPGSQPIAALGIHGQWAIVSVVFAMSIGFAADFLDIDRHLPRARRWFDVARRALLAAAFAVAASPWYLPAYGMCMSAVALVLYPAMVGVGVHIAWTRRDRYALYFLAGWVPMTIGTVLRALQAAGLIQVGNEVTYLYTVGVLLQSVVLMAGLADRLLRTRRERDHARHVAERDALTGTLTRRALDERLAAAVAGARSGGAGVALLFVDIDHFKRVNDTYSHATGDVVLHEVAQRIGGELRARDALGRWGGEEFVVLLPDAGIEDARALSERVRRAIAERPIDVGPMPVPTTISIGVAVFDPARDDAATLVARADAALYRAKAGGRNRVESAALEAA
jgi:diguanylate cyclase (GGDEF)-like protein